ncbi:CaiB/BaiF CoA transferase family protein [Gordonia polyisoprenivorans]|uniref:CaiB/BaiF CoA transferase family protein n=1 Tax=Gordonia polyisoprenivorans TaxID=84595 RepID=UPI001AD6CC0A|nr:CoA transferase [Gordonia polyisoprenivorans]QTI70937.1 CoA transferase [Gordonia polyisoprenivorans]
MSVKALDGIRILDLSRILAAPFASQMLGDLGAEVIKVEQPGKGDDARQYGPPFLHDSHDEGMSAFYLSCNRNKRAVTLDFTTGRGRELALDLIAQSDIVLENFRPGVLEKYGLGWDDLRERFPRLVMCSVTGFGQDGPYRHRPGYDGIFQAVSGMMSVSGVPDGQPGAGPMKSGLSLVDILTGLYTSSALLAALRHRDRTGEGQHLDVSLLDCGVASLSHFAENYLVSGEVPQRRGNGGFGGIPSQAFECADGKLIFIVATTNPQFSRACEVFGRPLIEDPRFNSIAARIEHRLELLGTLEQIFLEQPRAHWLEALEALDVPVGPVNTIEETLADEQVRFRQLQISMHDESLGDVAGLRYPIRMSATPVTEYTFPPRLGEDSTTIYHELLGLGDEEIQRLAAEGVI